MQNPCLSVKRQAIIAQSKKSAKINDYFAMMVYLDRMSGHV